MATLATVTEAEYRARMKDEMSAGADAAAASMKRLGAAVVVTDEQMTRAQRSTASLARSYDPVTAATSKLTNLQRNLADANAALARETAVGSTEQAKLERVVTTLSTRVQKAKEDLEALEKANAGAGAAISGVGNSVRLTTRELQQLSPQIADVGVTLLGGMNPLMVLVQQGPQITDAVGGIGRAFTLLRAAAFSAAGATVAAGAAVATITIIAESQNRALAELSNRLRVTRDDYEALALTTENAARRVAATTTLGTGEARVAGRTIASSRNFTGDEAELTRLIALSGRLATAMGVDAAAAAGKLAEALDRPRQAAEALAQSGLRGMDEGLVRTIRSLENQGRVAEAARLVMDAYNRSIGEIAKTPLQRAMDELSQSFTRLWQAVQPIVVGLGTGMALFFAEVARRVAQLVEGVNQLGIALRDSNVARFFFGDPAAANTAASASGQTALQRQLQLAREANPRFLQQRDNREQYGAAREALAGASGDDARLLRSRLTELNEAYRGMQGPVADYLKGLRDQAAASAVADGAARDLAQAEQQVRDAGGGAAEVAQARALVQRRLTNEFVNFIAVQNQAAISTRAQANAVRDGATAADDLRIQYEAEAQALKFARVGTEEYRLTAEILTGQLIQQRDAQQALNAERSISTQEQQLEVIQRETELVGAGVVVRERELAVLRERQRILNEPGADINSAQSQERLTNAGRIAEATQALQRQQSVFTELQRVGEQAFDRIGSAIIAAFANGTLQTIRFGNIARAVVSEIAQAFLRLAVINPIKNALFGGNAATLSLGSLAFSGTGLASNAGSTSGAMQQAGQSAGLYSAGQYGNLGNAFTGNGLANTGYSWIDGALNTQLTSASVSSTGYVGAGGVPIVDGSAGLTVGGAIGGGASILGGAYGIYSGLERGGVGGYTTAAGGALGVASGVSSILASLGVISASLGPIGWIGAAVLAIAGALLPGAKASGRGQESRVNMATGAVTTNGLTGDRYSAGNAAEAKSAAQNIMDLATQVGDKLGGARIGGDAAVGVTNTKLYLEVNGRKAEFTNDEAGSRALAEKAAQFVLEEFKSQGSVQGDYRGILKASNTLSELSKNLEWYEEVYKKFNSFDGSTSKFTKQMDALKKSWEENIAKAEAMELATDALTAARDREIAALQQQRDNQVANIYDSLEARAIAAGRTSGNTADAIERITVRQESRAAAEELEQLRQSLTDLGETSDEVNAAIADLTATQAAEAEQRRAERQRVRAYDANSTLYSIQARAEAVWGITESQNAIAAANAANEAENELAQLSATLIALGFSSEDTAYWVDYLRRVQEAEAAAAQSNGYTAAQRSNAAGSAAATVTSLQQYVTSLTTTQAGAGTAMDRLSQSRRRFDAVYGAAQAGDANSIAGLQSAAEAYRQAAREVFGGGQGFADAIAVIAERIGEIGDMGSDALTQAWLEENDRENTDRVVDAVGELKEELAALGESLNLLLQRPAA